MSPHCGDKGKRKEMHKLYTEIIRKYNMAGDKDRKIP